LAVFNARQLQTFDAGDFDKRLGGTGSAFDSDELPPKPRYMHWRTYRRLEAKYEELLNRWAVGAAGSVGIVHPDESSTS
jgi:hypothetical protein